MKPMSYIAAASAACVLTAVTAAAQITPPREKVLHEPDMQQAELVDGVRVTAAAGDMAMLAFNDIAAGAVMPRHNHPNEQITYVVSGKMKIFVEDREHLLGPGDLVVIPSYVVHGGEALETTRTIEAFGPTRADWQEFAE